MSREQREPEPITKLRKMLDTALQWAHSTYGNRLEDVTYLLTAYDDCRAQLADSEEREALLDAQKAAWIGRAQAAEARSRAYAEDIKKLDAMCDEERTRAERAELSLRELREFLQNEKMAKLASAQLAIAKFGAPMRTTRDGQGS